MAEVLTKQRKNRTKYKMRFSVKNLDIIITIEAEQLLRVKIDNVSVMKCLLFLMPQ